MSLKFKLQSRKTIALVFVSVLLASCTNRTVNTSGEMTEKMENVKICLIAGLPEKQYSYEIIQFIKFGKGSYGRVNDSIPEFIKQAKVLGADAIINYQGSQRFGFWPWRITRPVLRGDAIKWTSDKKINCEDAGGALH